MLKGIVFDMDGVLYRGENAIPGVAGEIARLQEKLQVLFFTNNATKSRKDYVSHLAIFGIAASEKDIMTSSFGVAHYVKEKFGLGKKVFVVGEQGMKDELLLEAKAKLVDKIGADIVVCGLDRQINYSKLEVGLRNLLSGAAFILANNDTNWIRKDGISPGTGSFGALLTFASGKKPDVIVGKPSTYLLDKLLEMHSLKASECAFVGDRLEIDIRMANNAGMKSVLVLTGIGTRKEAEGAPASDKPKIIIESAAEAGKALEL